MSLLIKLKTDEYNYKAYNYKQTNLLTALAAKKQQQIQQNSKLTI